MKKSSTSTGGPTDHQIIVITNDSGIRGHVQCVFLAPASMSRDHAMREIKNAAYLEMGEFAPEWERVFKRLEPMGIVPVEYTLLRM